MQKALRSKLSVIFIEDQGTNGDADRGDADACPPASKDCDEDGAFFYCGVFGCKEKMRSTEQFNRHFEQKHRHACNVCGASYTTGRLLDIHIRENHDAFFRIQAQRKPMYACLVADCKEIFKSNRARRQHLISVHMYPPSFRFHNAMKARRRRRRRRRKDEKKVSRNCDAGDDAKRPADCAVSMRVDDDDDDDDYNHDDNVTNKSRDRDTDNASFSESKQGRATQRGVDTVGDLEARFRKLKVPSTLSFGRRRRGRGRGRR